jgi:type III secretion protein U
VVRSVDVVTTIGTSGVLFALIVAFAGLADRMQAFLKLCLHAASDRSGDFLGEISRQALGVLGQALIPLSLAAILAVFFGNVLQFGFVLAFESMKPSLDKLNPINGLKRIFSLKGLVEFSKNLIKLILLVTVVTFVILQAIGPALLIPFGGIEAVQMVAGAMFRAFLIAVLLSYVAISIVDFLLQRMLLTKDLMMTKEEVKRENKENEGDPHIKGSRKQVAREMIFEDPPTATRKSTVLVTNPTHYAIGIWFEPGVTPVPKMRVKTSGFLALRMIEVAREAGVPVVENVPLARALHDRIDVGDFIPGDLLEPVAEILRWVATLPPRK